MTITRPGIYAITIYTAGRTASLPPRLTYLDAETAARNAVRLGARWAHVRNMQTGAILRVVEQQRSN